jgi:hypothetical protein
MIERVPEAKDESEEDHDSHNKTGFGSEVDDEEFGEVCGRFWLHGSEEEDLLCRGGHCDDDGMREEEGDEDEETPNQCWVEVGGCEELRPGLLLYGLTNKPVEKEEVRMEIGGGEGGREGKGKEQKMRSRE